MPVRLGMQIGNISILTAKQNWGSACGKPNLGEYTAKPNLLGDASVPLFLRFTIKTYPYRNWLGQNLANAI